jgi:DNA-nicking Smr family endonuclease
VSGKPPARRRRREITPAERALWAEVARSARPLPGRTLPESAEHPPPPAETAPPAPAPGAAPQPLRGPSPRQLPPLVGIERRFARALTRGSEPIDARLDLHGLRQAEAHQALRAFLHGAHAGGARIVLVITGKGGDAAGIGEGRGILRRLVPLWLADPDLRRLVLGFEGAGRAHGGEGALYVRLRRKRPGA